MQFSHPTHGHDERRRHWHGDDGHHRRGFGRRSGHPGSDEPEALELSHDHGSRGRHFGHRGRPASAATASLAKDAAAAAARLQLGRAAARAAETDRRPAAPRLRAHPRDRGADGRRLRAEPRRDLPDAHPAAGHGPHRRGDGSRSAQGVRGHRRRNRRARGQEAGSRGAVRAPGRARFHCASGPTAARCGAPWATCAPSCSTASAGTACRARRCTRSRPSSTRPPARSRGCKMTFNSTARVPTAQGQPLPPAALQALEPQPRGRIHRAERHGGVPAQRARRRLAGRRHAH